MRNETREAAPEYDAVRRSRWWRRGAIATVAVAVGVVAVGVAQQASTPVTPPSQVPVAVPAATRARFVRDLRSGRAPEVGTYLIAHPDQLPGALRTVHRAQTEQASGIGSGVIPLRPSLLADAGGRLTVVIVTDDDVPMRWEATRDVRDQGGPSRFRTVAASDGAVVAGVPASATASYPAEAPTQVAIELPVGVRWAALAVLSD